jgi:2-polyprenyl-6-methoxyphenol hydroxylase-like FAD-dependent oxidoreductase
MTQPLPNSTTCAIAGGGPAGMMLAYLLARAGVDVLVCEKHRDFLRDFRGDTIHPSTLQVMCELGLLDDFLKLPHTKVGELHGLIGDSDITIADFGHLPTQCRFIALMPQWDFLNFLSANGAALPHFHLAMEAEVGELIEEQGRIVGVRAHSPEGAFEVRAKLVIGADGRHSVVRERAGFLAVNRGAPIDVLWMRLSRRPDDPRETAGRFNYGRVLVLLDRGDYWQCAFVIHKDGYDAVRSRGLAALQDDIVRVAPFLRDRMQELRDWDDVKLLTVAVDRLERWWRPGLLCIGDSAHAMSPIGGVANILAQPLRDGSLSDQHLQAVQRRRMLPTQLMQGLQVTIQRRILDPIIGSDQPFAAPRSVQLFNRFPPLRRIPARVIGMGFRPEHVRTSSAAAPAT